MFYDQAHIEVKSGAGGNGAMSFRREKFIAFGGPDGGSGGQGGNVVLKADANLNTLIQFKYDKKFRAEDGGKGEGQNRHGKKGSDLIITVPIGTVVNLQSETEVTPVFDFTQAGETCVVAHGGKGGIGNLQLATPQYQAPRFAQLGEPGETKRLILELKLLADVGLIGLPNAGKSTLISVISNARPKIADYPFTTLVPNLGVVDYRGMDFVVADIPGLIAGAHQGKGLGQQFLRHIERTRVLVHLLDGSKQDPKELKKDFLTVIDELKKYDEQILRKPQIVILNKIDTMPEESLQTILENAALNKAILKYTPKPLLPVSAVAHKNTETLLDELKTILENHPKIWEKTASPIKVFNPAEENERYFDVTKTGQTFFVKGSRAEKIVITTPFENSEALRWMHDRLKAMGVVAELEKRGILPGDKVSIAGKTFDWE